MALPDLLALTAELVDIPSVSHDEQAIADHLERELRALGHLAVERVGDNVVARTDLGRGTRVVLAGHTDTVPANGNERARLEDDVLWGLGTADMKGGLAVFLALARSLLEPAVDLTYVFYAGEEVAAEHNGLGQLVRERPELVTGDVALLGEPTGGELEAGCQGMLRLEVRLRGERAHSARPWMGRNAVHRLGPVLDAVAAVPERRPVVDGCEFREALQAVGVVGGVAGNVIPDLATLTLNRRFAPDRTGAEAQAEVEAVLAPHLEPGDEVVLLDVAEGARPGLDHPVLQRLVHEHGLAVTAKLGWTDVARFSELGIPACNLGPGDATLAHQAGERVERSQLERTYLALEEVLQAPLD
jgi:succinyl-diaminopimelate desuccinylase